MNVTRNIQPLQEYYIFIAVIYLIILLQMVNVEMLGNMEHHFAKTSHYHLLVLLVFLFDHTLHCLDGLAFTGFGGIVVCHVPALSVRALTPALRLA